MLLLMFYWMLMDMCLPVFDNYQGTVAPNCFKSHANSRCPDFFQEKVCLVSCLKFTLYDVDDDVEVPHSARASRSVVLQHNHLVVR